ncbi:MAG: 16S rRNA (uracil(1498)-N(3))-methyltransferase [Candidatus Desulfofervidaceae bacterium]|nr:16S rRNA (uracil(1498)-N(3))-methyltransferase [Candidatus Desulfofervidaceae bacterium]
MSGVLRRFYLPPEEIRPSTSINGKAFHHLKNVLRLKEREQIEITDGEGCIYLSRIKRLKKDRAEIEILKKVFIPPPAVKINLGLSLLKSRVMDWAVQKATELGVWKLYVYLTEHTVPLLEDEDKKTNRWRKIAVEAIKQSGHPYLPQIEICSFPAFITQAGGVKLMAAGPRELEDTQPIFSVLLKQSQIDSIWIGIGPEGGFSPAEFYLARTHGFIPVSLGPSILRAETAVIAAISVIQAFYGEWFKDRILFPYTHKGNEELEVK